jgi:hypothetical protein
MGSARRGLFGAAFALSVLTACTEGGDGSGGGGAGGDASGGGSAIGGAGGTSSTSISTGSSTGQGGMGPMGPPCDAGAGVMGVCVDVADCVGNYVPVPNHCPGAANIQCCVPLGSVPCDPAAAPLPNEGLVEAPGEGGCPSGMLRVDTFCVDRYEASLVYVADGKSFSPYHNPGMSAVRAVSIEGAVPQGYIDGEQASAACAASGKRLCTDLEWLRACQGPTGTTYPYGDVDMLGVCNDHRAVHPAVELYGTTDPSIYSHLDNACLNQLPSSLDKAGANPGCVTAEGAYDMMGNLHEWTADPAGTFRGGYYVDTVLNGPGCLYVTTAHNTLHWDYSTGFRCCAD